MNLFISIYIFIAGLVLGSFFNVVGLRVPMKQSIASPPSQCPHCGERLRAADLVPIVSWLIARGRCRHCHARVSVVYPLGELATGLLFLWMYLTLGYCWETLIGLLLVSLAVVISVSDLKYMLIPNRILFAFAPIFLVLRCLFPIGSIAGHLWGALIAGGALLLVVIVSRGGMGMGDVKLFALLGWVLGMPNVIAAFLFAFLIATIVGAALLWLGIVQRKQPIPFGPFLAGGALLAFAYGSEWIPMYLSLFD